jgi:hypothetical protein
MARRPGRRDLALLRRYLTDDQRAMLALKWQRRHAPGRGHRTDLEPRDTVSRGSSKHIRALGALQHTAMQNIF